MCTVLLVDDEDGIRRLCFEILARSRHHHILEACSGDHALDVAARFDGEIEVLLSDIAMPGGVSGVELAERLTASRPEIKVLLMSGHCPEQFAIQSEWHFLAKPFRPSDLLEKIDAILAGVPSVKVAL